MALQASKYVIENHNDTECCVRNDYCRPTKLPLQNSFENVIQGQTGDNTRQRNRQNNK